MGGNIYIRNPTLNIIGGSTISNLLQFAPILAAEPFYSRTILVYSPPTFQTYIPTELSQSLVDKVVANLRSIREMHGVVKFEEDARILFDTIISEAQSFRIADARLNPYYARRNLHLRKLCIILAVCKGSKEIQVHDVMHANSILVYTESFMQRALTALS